MTIPVADPPAALVSSDERIQTLPAGQQPGAPRRPMAAPDRRRFEGYLAEILGIWRHARGRVVGLHRPWGAAATVDVKFEGHETLERYLPDLFRRAH